MYRSEWAQFGTKTDQSLLCAHMLLNFVTLHFKHKHNNNNDFNARLKQHL